MKTDPNAYLISSRIQSLGRRFVCMSGGVRPLAHRLGFSGFESEPRALGLAFCRATVAAGFYSVSRFARLPATMPSAIMRLVVARPTIGVWHPDTRPKAD
jgi:hypothetical protein